MTPRLRLSHSNPTWTELFKPIRGLRNIRVVIDAELWDDRHGEWTAKSLLSGFLTCQGIEFWRYTEDDPPPGARWCPTSSGGRVAIGWMTAKADPSGGPDQYVLAYVANERGIQWQLEGEPRLFALNDQQTRAYEALDSAEATARRIADAVAACAARQAKADLYVTDREYLHKLNNMTLAPSVTFCTPADALALVSLYLRTQGEFLAWKDPKEDVPVRFGKRTFYWVGARELLPQGWRWFSACVAHSNAQEFVPGANNLTYLGGAVFQRVAGVLQARDDVMRTVNRKQDSQIVEDSLTALDVCLIFLMGALDATARVAHHVLGFPAEQARNAGWQREKWLKKVEEKAPELARVVAPGTDGSHALTIVRLLRNTVHDTGLRALGVIQHSVQRETTLAGVCLSATDRADIIAATDHLGGRDAWSIQELLPEMLHFDPGVLLDRLLPAVMELLNKLMAKTPVESLAGVSLKSSDLIAPLRDPDFDENQRHSVRWQLGL
jgi:hypothetical protein